jgi:hypothetical protein
LAYANLHQKAELTTPGAFSSIHSFLAHCAMISKMLQGRFETTSIGDVLGLAPNSLIHDRRFRDHLEHYYDWLQKLAKKVGKSPVAIHTIGPRHMIRVENVVLISHYDPGHCIFTFMGDDFDLASMNAEANRIEEIADQWINDRVDRDRDRARRRHGEPPR